MTVFLKSRGRQAAALALTLLPFPLVWLGLYKLHTLWGTFGLYHGLCLISYLFARDRVRIGRPTRRQVLGALIAGAVASVAIFILYQIAGPIVTDPPRVRASLEARGFRPSQLTALGIYFVVVNPVLEELFWRGAATVLLEGVASDLPMRTGLRRPDISTPFTRCWIAASFGSWHFLAVRLLMRPGWSIAGVVGIMLAGLLLDRQRRTTGSLALPMLWHSLVLDLPIIVVGAAVFR